MSGRRTVALLVAVSVVAVAALVAGDRVLGTEDPAALGFGHGPRWGATRDWAVDIRSDHDTQLSSDGERVYVVQADTSSDDLWADEDEVPEVWGRLTVHDARSGEELWARDVEHGWVTEPLVHPLGDGQVLVTSGPATERAQVALHDAVTGRRLWQVDGTLVSTDGWIATSVPPVRDAPAVVVHDLDLDDVDGLGATAVRGVDPASGEELWEDEAAQVHPCGEAVLLLSSGGVDPRVVDVRTGDELWRVDGSVGGCTAEQVAIVDDGEVEVRAVADGRTVGAFDLPGSPPSDDAVLATPVDGGILVTAFPDEYEDPPVMTMHRLPDGEVRWEGDGYPTQVVGDGLLLVSRDDDMGFSVVRAADGGEGGADVLDVPTVLWPCGLVSTGAQLFTCEGRRVTAVRAATLREAWSVDVGDAVTALAVGGDRVFVATDDGELAAYR